MRPVIVVKIGSQTLLNQAGQLDLAFLDSIANQVAQLHKMGKQVVLVSSGAIACGRSVMHDPDMDSSLSDNQALAAIGQTHLAHRWQVACDAYGLQSAQLLLTNDDFKDRQRYLNITSTLRSLFDHEVIPVVNENDTVAVEELTLGDNDRLAAMLAGQLHAEQLIILTDIDGVYDKNPQVHKDAQLLKEIAHLDEQLIKDIGGSSQGNVGRGGMRSKLQGAHIASAAGVETKIVPGRAHNVILDATQGNDIGSTILASKDANIDSRRHWLALARRCEGGIHIDAGATTALLEKGTSLLPVGIKRIDGSFERGDTVSVYDDQGQEIARGLSGLGSIELDQIKGMRLDKAAELLGYVLPKTAIHRDNLLLL